jgi:hypothetical protein
LKLFGQYVRNERKPKGIIIFGIDSALRQEYDGRTTFCHDVGQFVSLFTGPERNVTVGSGDRVLSGASFQCCIDMSRMPVTPGFYVITCRDQSASPEKKGWLRQLSLPLTGGPVCAGMGEVFDRDLSR